MDLLKRMATFILENDISESDGVVVSKQELAILQQQMTAVNRAYGADFAFLSAPGKKDSVIICGVPVYTEEK